MFNPNDTYKEYQRRFPKEIAERQYSLRVFHNLLAWLDVLESGNVKPAPSWPSPDMKKSLLEKTGRGSLYKTFQRSEKARFRFISYLADLAEDTLKINLFFDVFQDLWDKHQPKLRKKIVSLQGIKKELAQREYKEAKRLMLLVAQEWHSLCDEECQTEKKADNFIQSLEGWSPKSSQQAMDDMESQAEFSKILQKIFRDKTPDRADEISWGLGAGIWHDYGDDFLEKLVSLKDKKEIQDLVQKLGRNPSDETSNPIEGFKVVAAQEQPLESDELDLPPAGYRGYEYGKDISRLASNALMLLADVETEILFDMKFAKCQLPLLKQRCIISDMQAQDGGSAQKRSRDPHAQKEPAQRGPIIALLDTSGSMDGRRTEISKAVLLVMVLMAYAEKRSVFVINFSSYSDVETIECNLGSNMIKDFIDFLKFSFSGGTEPLYALEKGLEKVEESESWHKADLVMISDGEFGAHSDMKDKLKKSAEIYGTRLFGVCVKGVRGSFENLCEQGMFFELN